MAFPSVRHQPYDVEVVLEPLLCFSETLSVFESFVPEHFSFAERQIFLKLKLRNNAIDLNHVPF